MVLRRHWMWANIMREHFDLELNQKRNEAAAPSIFADRLGAYMSLWYGMLFGVLEVVKEKKLSIEGLEDMDSIFNELRLYRNAIFHPQPEYWSKKLSPLVEDRTSVAKIRKIHGLLGKYFLGEIQSKRHKSDVHDVR